MLWVTQYPAATNLSLAFPSAEVRVESSLETEVSPYWVVASGEKVIDEKRHIQAALFANFVVRWPGAVSSLERREAYSGLDNLD